MREPEPRTEPKEGIDYDKCTHEFDEFYIERDTTTHKHRVIFYIERICKECHESLGVVIVEESDIEELFYKKAMEGK